jgi:hypothetical protein
MRRAVAAAVVAVFAMMVGAPAGAEFGENSIGCSGRALVTDDEGETYDIDAEDSEVVVPRSGSAQWEGSIETVTHNHSGEVVLEVGPMSVGLGDWGPSENDNDEASANGVKEIPEILEQVPAGKYDVSGFHQGDEGRCAGAVTVEVDGSPFDTIAGVVNAGLTLLTGALLLIAMFAVSSKPSPRGRPVLGAVAGLLFGLFLAIELVFLKVISSGSPLVLILPVVMLVIGVAAALAAPFGRGRAGAGPGPGAPPGPAPA